MSDNYTVDEAPTASELLAAVSAEAGKLAEEVGPGVRKRLLVLTHTTQLVARELAAADTPAANDRGAARRLAAAIRAGEYDDQLGVILARVRPEVRARVEISTPGYAD